MDRKAMFSILLIAFSILCGMNDLCGKEVLKEKAYIEVFLEKMDQWDNKKFIVNKKTLQNQFAERLKLRVEYKMYNYENEEWFKAGLELWDELPEKLEAKLPISDVSRNILYAIFHENLPEYMEFIDITGLDLRQDLDVPFFGIFGIAQGLAIKYQEREITAPEIGVALEKSKKTYHWPMCPKPPKD